MLGYSDKFTLTTINAISKDGKKLDYVLSFPLEDNDFYIPDDIIEISIFEYHEGYTNYGFIPFKIYVGKTTSIKEIVDSHKENISFFAGVTDTIKNTEDRLCYFLDDKENKKVFARLNDGDIVVEDTDGLRDALITISNNFQNIKNSVSRIRQYKSEADSSIETEEEQILRKKRIQMCINQRKQ